MVGMAAVAVAWALILSGDGIGVTGGKISWRGVKEVNQAVEEAGRTGKPVILYFTADWAPPAQSLGSGAFSDDRVVEASWGFIRVIIPPTKGDAVLMRKSTSTESTELLKNADPMGEAIMKRWQITAVPTLIFLDPDGKPVDRWVGTRDPQNPDSMAQWFRRILARHSRAPGWAAGLEAALRKGRAEGRPVLAFWTDGRPGAEEMEAGLGDKSLNDFRARFVWVRFKLRTIGDAEARRFEVSKAPLLLALDARPEDGTVKVIFKYEGGDPARLKEDLEALLKEWEPKQPGIRKD
jgi:hypothetical protein